MARVEQEDVACVDNQMSQQSVRRSSYVFARRVRQT